MIVGSPIFLATLLLLLLVLPTSTLASNAPQILRVNRPYETIIQTTPTVPSFAVLQSTGTDKRNTVAIALTMAAFFAFGLGMTIVLCFRHHKRLCFSPPKATAAVALVDIDASAPDSAPDDAIMERCQQQIRLQHENGAFNNSNQLGNVEEGIELQQTATVGKPKIIMA